MKATRDFVPIICSSTLKFLVGTYRLLNKLFKTEEIVPSLYSLYPGESRDGCSSLSAR